MTNKILHFNEMDVEVSQASGEWQSWEAGTYDCDCDQDGFFVCCPIGSGKTMLEAIADLAEVLEARQSR
jgi:hypothetical protein